MIESLYQLDSELHLLQSDFQRQFGRRPQWIVGAPGRVNLIGEHTDYNHGFVMPMAIDRRALIAVAAASTHEVPVATLVSSELKDEATFELTTNLMPAEPFWSNYIKGVFAQYLQKGHAFPTLQIMLRSGVPLGSGLSSSAAIEVATCAACQLVLGLETPAIEQVKLCQTAEHTFPGVPCGIMDQTASIFGKKGHLLLIDCQSEQVTPVPFADSNLLVLIANTNVHHSLASGEYAARRKTCETAAKRLSVDSLRSVSLDQLTANQHRLDELEFRRARHVVTENQRVLDFAAAVRNRDWQRAGERMYQSHTSLRDDYQVSCDELDALVSLLQQQGGVIGARMTGGGFGGCVVAIVQRDQAKQIASVIEQDYQAQFGKLPTIYATLPSAGVRTLVGS